jgi:hypothetical protein
MVAHLKTFQTAAFSPAYGFSACKENMMNLSQIESEEL